MSNTESNLNFFTSVIKIKISLLEDGNLEPVVEGISFDTLFLLTLSFLGILHHRPLSLEREVLFTTTRIGRIDLFYGVTLEVMDD